MGFEKQKKTAWRYVGDTWLRMSAVLLVSCGGGGGVGAGGSPAGTAASSWVWGVTTDDPTINTGDQVEALRALPKHVMVRTTFDRQNSPPHYSSSVMAIAAVADVMGQPIDSSDMSSLDLQAVTTRINQYLNAFGDTVKVWEVGNEVNGNWLGSGVMPKIEAMYDAVKAACKPAALTLYYETPATSGYDMIPWVDTNIPSGHRMRSGLDYVLVSYYEDQNGGHQLTHAEITTIFSALAQRFPNAKLGFGEFGWGGAVSAIPSADSIRADLIQRFYSYRAPDVPNYIGGGFYWHFRQTMTPKTQPDWAVLNGLLGSRP